MSQKIARWSKTHLYTLKEAPADAEIPSHILLVRSGMVKKLSQGLFTYGTLALRAIRKFEAIIREEMDSAGAQEVLMPMVQPKELWQQSGRWEVVGDLLLKFKNRTQADFCLGATHEEVITDYVRNDLKSHKDLPRNIYQIQTKYRDEVRPRFGLMRCREFIMKDAYSFDVAEAGALRSYEVMKSAYHKIFQRVGLEYRMVAADAGAIGGAQTHEFQVLAEVGEDTLLVAGDFAANVEIAPSQPLSQQQISAADQKLLPIEEFATPGCLTIEDLSRHQQIAPETLVKSIFLKVLERKQDGQMTERFVAVLLRGSDELNPIKLKNALNLSFDPEMLSELEVLKLTGAKPGSCGPVGLNPNVAVYADQYLQGRANMIVGANRDGFHLRNVNVERDFKVSKWIDLRLTQAGDICPHNGLPYHKMKGIEVGHIFYLGTKYSAAMQAQFQGEDGKLHPFEMGCYGIGVSRTIQAAIEQSHDSDGIIWPMSLAPFHLHLCHLDPGVPEVDTFVEELLSQLSALGVEVFVDDRSERPGVKFKDADLLGFPLRLVVGKKGFVAGEIELVERRSKQKTICTPQECTDKVLQQLKLLGF